MLVWGGQRRVALTNEELFQDKSPSKRPAYQMAKQQNSRNEA